MIKPFLKKYERSMKNVFLQCLIINLINITVCLFWTPASIVILLNIISFLSVYFLIYNIKKTINTLINNYNNELIATESLSHIKQYIEKNNKEKEKLLNTASNIIQSTKNAINA